MKILSRLLIVIGAVLLVLALAGFLLNAHFAQEFGVAPAAVKGILTTGNTWGLDRFITMGFQEAATFFLILYQQIFLYAGAGTLVLGILLAVVRRSGANRAQDDFDAPPVFPDPFSSGAPAYVDDPYAAYQRPADYGAATEYEAYQPPAPKAGTAPRHRQAWQAPPSPRGSDGGQPLRAFESAPPPPSPRRGYDSQAIPPMEPPAPGALAICLEGEYRGVPIRKDAVISPEGSVVGRNTACQITLGERSVSRRHCRLWVSEGRLFAENLSDTNPLQVNGMQVPEGAVELENGDMLTLGLLELKLLFL